MNEMQKMMLDMMKWFHELCRVNSIKYYIVGGTMLGAARHKGFIPWDDDIDVGLPREDYNRLLSNKDKLIGEKSRYIIESVNDGNDDFIFLNAKVFDTQTTLVENNVKKTKRGIFLDIFPLDGIGETKEEALRNFLPIARRTNLLMALTCEIRKERSFFKNLAIFCFKLIPFRDYLCRVLIRNINKLCMERNFDKSKFVGNLVGNWGVKEIMLREYFGEPQLYDFEGCQFYGPEKFDVYLQAVYRDWRSLPPKDKQKSDHGFLEIDLHNSYKDK